MTNQDHIDQCIMRGWRIAAELLTSLSAVLSPTRSLTGAAKREALALLRVVEAMVRRVLVLLAAQLKPRTPSTTPQTLPDFSQFTPAEPDRTPLFTLTEAQAAWPQENPDSGPRIRLLDDALLAQPSTSKAAPDDLNTRFWHRLAALQHVAANQRKHVRRMARWLAHARALTGPGRRFPMRPGRPPGYSARRRTRDPLTQSSLMDLSSFAWQILAPP